MGVGGGGDLADDFVACGVDENNRVAFGVCEEDGFFAGRDLDGSDGAALGVGDVGEFTAGAEENHGRRFALDGELGNDFALLGVEAEEAVGVFDGRPYRGGGDRGPGG